MNASASDNKFVPKQALAPTPQLYNELVSDTMEQLAKTSLAQIPPIQDGSVVHDNGCGTGSGTAAIVETFAGSKSSLLVNGTEINENALEIYKRNATGKGWPV